MVTSGLIHWVLDAINFHVHIRDICVFLAPTFSGLTAIATYFLTKELWSTGAGLFAACFIAITPGYTSRSVAGSYDNEGIAIFALQVGVGIVIFLVKILVHIFPMDQIREDWIRYVGLVRRRFIFLYGFRLGRIRLHH